MKKISNFSKMSLLVLLFPLTCIAQTYNITEFGAKEGENATKAIQAAVDACHQHGGGRVIIPPGTFITSTIFLKSHVDFHLSSGGILQASTQVENYKKGDLTYGLIYAEDAHHITISGRGTINGQALAFYDSTKNHRYPEINKAVTRQGQEYMPDGVFDEDGPYARKPEQISMTIEFVYCENIKFLNFTVKDTPTWSFRIANCKDIDMRGVTIKNNPNIPNSDGPHFTRCKNVMVSNCNFSCGDDAIVFTGFPITINIHATHRDITEKKFRYGNPEQISENFTVTNCVLSSRSSAIRIGYDGAPLRNGVFSNITIYDSNRGIMLNTRDKNTIDNVLFKNITIQTRVYGGQWWGNGEPIHISALPFNDKGEGAGKIKNVKFQNIIAESDQSIFIYGDDADLIEDIRFDGLKLKLIQNKRTLDYGGNFDMKPANDIDKRVFAHDIPGIYCKNVKGLNLENVSMEWGDKVPDFFTYAFEAENITGLILRDISASKSHKSDVESDFFFKNVTHVFKDNLRNKNYQPISILEK